MSQGGPRCADGRERVNISLCPKRPARDLRISFPTSRSASRPSARRWRVRRARRTSRPRRPRRTARVRRPDLRRRGRRRVRRALAARAAARRARDPPRVRPALRVRRAGRHTLPVHLGRGRAELAVWPVVAGGIGVGIIWQQADPERRRRWVRNTQGMWLRSIIGTLLVAAGLIAFLAQKVQPGQAGQVLLGSTVVLTGVAVVLAPWLAAALARPGHRAPRADPVPRNAPRSPRTYTTPSCTPSP